jgi:TfoX/Sxy family transcriptional regulator of competence genes
MAYDAKLVNRIAEVLADMTETEQKKMFGGVAFMVGGYMCCGVANEALMLRIGPKNYAEALEQPHVRPMDFTGRPLKGYIYVDAEGISTRSELRKWLTLALEFVRSLPTPP